MGQLTTEGIQWSSPDGNIVVSSRVKYNAEDEEKRRIVVNDEKEMSNVEVVVCDTEDVMDKLHDAKMWAEGYWEGKYNSE